MSLLAPTTDATPIFEAFRGNHATEVLTAAVAHLKLFDQLADAALPPDEIGRRLGLAERPMQVLLTALAAMKLIERRPDGTCGLTALSREHLVTGGPHFVGDYVGLAADSPGVRELVERLRTNLPAGSAAAAVDSTEDRTSEVSGPGAAFVYREGEKSAMDQADSARRLTLALAGRARNVAPIMAQRASLAGTRRLLDVGGGTGLYSIALLQHHPHLRAVVWDRPEVLKVAEELAAEHGVLDRVELLPGDMFADPVPEGIDAMLLSNILHDWDVPDCQALVRRCAAALPLGGRMLIHDVFLNDELDGPLPIALYSVALFTLTHGRAYSAAEYRDWLAAAGLRPEPIIPTAIHCGLLTAIKL
jgi:predicted O-methyltransferase YrrM